MARMLGVPTEYKCETCKVTVGSVTEIDRLRAESAVPGEWTCDKCGFGLSTRTMHAHTGAVSVRRVVETDVCPNDGTPLRSLTWKELAESQRDHLAELMPRLSENAALSQRVRDLEQLVADIGYYVSDICANGDGPGFNFMDDAGKWHNVATLEEAVTMLKAEANS